LSTSHAMNNNVVDINRLSKVCGHPRRDSAAMCKRCRQACKVFLLCPRLTQGHNEFGWIACSENADAFVAFTGLDPRPDDSGQHHGKRRLSKRGPTELCRLLYLAALSGSSLGASPVPPGRSTPTKPNSILRVSRMP
jgi:hypothetical protein